MQSPGCRNAVSLGAHYSAALPNNYAMSHPGSRTPHKLIPLFSLFGPLFTVLPSLLVNGACRGILVSPHPQQTALCYSCDKWSHHIPTAFNVPGATCCSNRQGQTLAGAAVGSRAPGTPGIRPRFWGSCRATWRPLP